MKHDWNNMEQLKFYSMVQNNDFFSEIVASKKKMHRDVPSSQTLNAGHQDGWLHIFLGLEHQYCCLKTQTNVCPTVNGHFL